MKKLKSIYIDTEKGLVVINGEPVERVSHLCIEADGRKWSLAISKTEKYEAPKIIAREERETVKDEAKKQTDIKESADKVIEYVSNKISAGKCAPAEEANMMQALAELISARAKCN